MVIIDGREIASEILIELKSQVSRLSFKPVFCDILVGDDPVSASYVRIKARAAERVGVEFRQAVFPADISSAELGKEIKKLNQVENLCGLIVQLPLPGSLDQQEILDLINPELDVDCMGTLNMGDLYSGNSRFVPPTAAAIVEILRQLPLDLPGQKILVLGQGELVGRPVSFLLRQQNLNVAVADKSTSDIETLLRESDIIISATGQSGLVTGGKIKPGAVVIDAGTSESNGSIVGDADFESVSKVAGFVSPVPGGVGPVTVAMLLKNVVEAAKNVAGS